MKVLFASATDTDWLASTLWQGLVEVLGQSNVFDASGGCRSLPNIPVQAVNVLGNQRGFNLLVINSCFLRQHGWEWVCGHLGVESKGEANGRLLPTAKIIYVEGQDAVDDINVPPFRCDAYFRREIRNAIQYPYPCEPLFFAMPSWSFDLGDHERDVDVCFLARVKDIPIRHETLRIVERMRGRCRIVAHGNGTNVEDYVDIMRRSKLCICLPGGAYCGNCMRDAECLAYGAIPVYVYLPDNMRDTWHPDSTYAWCAELEQLPSIIEYTLTLPLDSVRKRLQLHALENHTTKARALKLLKAVGMKS